VLNDGAVDNVLVGRLGLLVGAGRSFLDQACEDVVLREVSWGAWAARKSRAGAWFNDF
jgi:hypothetical protein